MESGAWPVRRTERHGTWTPLVAARSRWTVMEPETRKPSAAAAVGTSSPRTAAARLNEKEKKSCFLAAAMEPAAAARLSKN